MIGRDEILNMAREADPFGPDGRLHDMAELAPGTLLRFAAIVEARALAAEREACAKVCELIAAADEYAYADECVAAIRARSKT